MAYQQRAGDEMMTVAGGIMSVSMRATLAWHGEKPAAETRRLQHNDMCAASPWRIAHRNASSGMAAKKKKKIRSGSIA